MQNRLRWDGSAHSHHSIRDRQTDSWEMFHRRPVYSQWGMSCSDGSLTGNKQENFFFWEQKIVLQMHIFTKKYAFNLAFNNLDQTKIA